jgi:hypothetical protein
MPYFGAWHAQAHHRGAQMVANTVFSSQNQCDDG